MAFVPTRYDHADGDRALQLAQQQTVEQLEISVTEEERWYSRSYWKKIAFAYGSMAAYVAYFSVSVKFGWMPPIWTITLMLVPLFTLVNSLGTSERQTGAALTYRLAVKIRREMDQTTGTEK